METKNTARKRGLSNGKEAIENEKLIKSISTTNPWGMVMHVSLSEILR